MLSSLDRRPFAPQPWPIMQQPSWNSNYSWQWHAFLLSHAKLRAIVKSMSQDIRWKQRFGNFERGFVLLREALERKPEELSMLEKEGVIQRFEYTFELAWKTLKDYLEDGGLVISPVTPRQVIKEAFAAKVISDGDVWIHMLDHRNLLSHTYDSSVFEQAVDAIAERYLSAMTKLHEFFKDKNTT